MIFKKVFRKVFKKRKTKNRSGFSYKPGIFLAADLAPLPLDMSEFAFNYNGVFDNTNFIICRELQNRCYNLSYYQNTQTFVLSDESFCHLMDQHEAFVNNVANALNLEKNQAKTAIANYFEDKTFLVQQQGLQGYLYSFGTYLEGAGSSLLTYKTLAMARLEGVTGMKLIIGQPLIAVALPTVGALFFYGCGALAGQNIVGSSCNTIGNILIIPMSYAELIFNVYVSPIINRTIGVPTVLNYTRQIKRGPGLELYEALKVIKDSNKSSMIGAIKCFVFKMFGGKC